MDGSGPRAHRRVAALQSARSLLGVPADADLPELTRAYWRQARTLHPDRNSNPEATQQFQNLNAAYRLIVDSLQHRPPAAVVPPPAPRAPRMARPTTGGRESADPASSRSQRSSPTHVTRSPHASTASTGPRPFRPVVSATDDGVWVMAGPVHVQPPRQPDTTTRNPAGERP
jgi:hypothetical protein